MARQAAEMPAARRNNDYTVEFSGETESLSDYFFGFSSDEGLQTPDSSCDSGDGFDDEDDDSCPNADERRAFWESQEQLLKGTLCRTSSIEAKIRQATKESLKELISGGFRCGCRNQANGDCRSCLRSEVCNSLLQKGFSCAICKSKWRSSPEIPSGEHTFLEVIDRSNPKKGETRVIIELNFRSEFEMAKGSSDYNQLTSRLPEVFVGKEERLRSVIKVMCAAAKRCMREKKIHIGPWRKHKYMQAKWLGKCERSVPAPPAAAALPAVTAVRGRRPRASLLTFDLVSDLQCTAVEVV